MGKFTRWLTAEPLGTPGLMLVHWWWSQSPKILELFPIHWYVKPVAGVSAGLLAGRAKSWSLFTWPRNLRTCFRSLVEAGTPVPDTPWCGVQRVPKLVLAC